MVSPASLWNALKWVEVIVSLNPLPPAAFTWNLKSCPVDVKVAGYCNVTAAIDAVQFAMSGGNIDAGTIKLYGIKDS